jgi:hypothetical protein
MAKVRLSGKAECCREASVILQVELMTQPVLVILYNWGIISFHFHEDCSEILFPKERTNTSEHM